MPRLLSAAAFLAVLCVAAPGRAQTADELNRGELARVTPPPGVPVAPAPAPAYAYPPAYPYPYPPPYPYPYPYYAAPYYDYPYFVGGVWVGGGHWHHRR
jgi:hypothetical protein